MQLENYIKIYDNALDSAVCDNLVNFFESKRGEQQLSGKTKSEHVKLSQWKELNLVKHMNADAHQQFVRLFKDYKERYEKDCKINSGLPYTGKLSDLRIKKYEANNEDQFEPHFDSAQVFCNRYLVFLWYLNDVEQGGETEFVDLGIKVKPKKGSLLIFPPFWMYRHKGNPPISNPKYIINTFLLW